MSSNERGDGQWEITGPHTLMLAAARHGNGSGRIYSILVECSDTAGNVSAGLTTSLVPHDRAK